MSHDDIRRRFVQVAEVLPDDLLQRAKRQADIEDRSLLGFVRQALESHIAVRATQSASDDTPEQ